MAGPKDWLSATSLTRTNRKDIRFLYLCVWPSVGAQALGHEMTHAGQNTQILKDLSSELGFYNKRKKD
jgi:hypothetical protein